MLKSPPLHRLTGLAPWLWSAKEQHAFEDLKLAATSAPVLAIPADDAPYCVEANSSGYATGAVLSQFQPDGLWHPVAFLSKTLSKVEQNYDIYDREMLAVMRALEEWRPYLMGATHPFEIWMDHKNLQYFQTAQKLNCRQACWALDLAEYNFSFVHKPGHDQKQPDALSRHPDYDKGSNDNNDEVLLGTELFRAIIDLSTEGDSILHNVCISRCIEKTMQKRAERGVSGWRKENRLILYHERVYIPKNRSLRERVIHTYHNSSTAGHPGHSRTTELILRDYWWPRVYADIAAYVHGCDRCQWTKTFHTQPVGTLAPNLVPDRPWQIISVNLISHLPLSHGYDAVVVIVDRFSKIIQLTPMNAELSSEERVISDCSLQFASSFMRDLNQLLGIQSNLSTAYHPQTDGQTERVNQEVEQYLCLFVSITINSSPPLVTLHSI
ncbi:hypothetical protein AX14_008687 [Amanita brunnescens Koide BX004]|nr:hypothetical protein AX14_008687 [Amanita brunnescens Koide BX004]